MEVLYFLEGLRTNIGNEFFSLITHFGEETIFILLGMLFFWCIDKKQGYYLLTVGFIGTVANQFLKLFFRIPRPWVKDENFTIVESARGEATGYSFPSGHTQTAVGVYGGVARWNKNWVLRVVCISLCILVPFSRMYLGVHTPADVGVSLIFALLLVFGVYPVVKKAAADKKMMRILFGVMSVLTVAFLIFVYVYPFPEDVDMDNLTHGMSNAWKMLGCMVGLWIVYELDEKYIHFDTRAVWWAQIIKLVIGLLPVLMIKVGLKQPLYQLFGGGYGADGLRYFLMVLIAGAVWPLTFRFFSKLGKK